MRRIPRPRVAFDPESERGRIIHIVAVSGVESTCNARTWQHPDMDEEWYYCIEHETVEPKLGCRITTRIGPFPTAERAANALERVRERNEDWESDPGWNDEDDG